MVKLLQLVIDWTGTSKSVECEKLLTAVDLFRWGKKKVERRTSDKRKKKETMLVSTEYIIDCLLQIMKHREQRETTFFF